MLQPLANEFVFALRSLSRSPAFALTAVLTIALGAGVNTAVFQIIHSVLLDPLPFRAPERLVHVAETHPEFPSFQVAAPDFFDWQKSSTSFDEFAAHTFQEMNKWTILGEGEPEQVQTVQASARLFPMMGIEPLIGHLYTTKEESDKAPVVLMSESLWRRKYGADPTIVGRTIRLVDWPVIVAGIIPQRQAQPPWAEIWMPLTFLDPALTKTRRFHTLEVIGRLRPGASVAQAQAEMKGIAANLASAYPDTNGRVGVSVTPLASWVTGEVRPALLMAWGAVSLVLLLACANVSHLVLVRTVHRTKEIALRAALGAGTGRLTRFLLAENLCVAAAGGALGALLARLTLPLLAAMAAGEIPRVEAGALSLAAVGFGIGATLLCAVLFALPAIIYARQLNLLQVIKQSGGEMLSRRRGLFGASLIAMEVALSFAVLAGAGLLYRSFENLLREETGIDASGVLAVDMPLALSWEQSAKLFEQRVAPAFRVIPGVRTVAAANCGPMMLHSKEVSRFSGRFALDGQDLSAGNFPVAQLRWTTLDYFQTLRIPLRRGRFLAESDIGKQVVIVNQVLAQRYYPNQDPIGRRILTDVVGPAGPTASEIVGVVGDVRDLGFDVEPRPTLYSLAVSNRMTLLIRTDSDPASIAPAVRKALRAVSPNAPIGRTEPLESVLRSSLARKRFALTLLGVFAALAGILTVVGVYGVIGYSLSLRTSEFAIRFALGANRGDVLRLILRGFALPAIGGVACGAWLAYLFARAMRGELYKLSPADPAVLSGCAIGLVLLVLAAALSPSLKASSISPMQIARE